MSVIIAVLTGFLAGRFVWLLVRPVFHHEVFMRENYRGVVLPTGVGIVLVFAVGFAEAARLVVGKAGIGQEGLSAYRAATLLALVGYGLVGLLDDVAGDGSARGFRGHLSALSRGHLTTGSIKLFAGACFAIIVASLGNATNTSQLLVDAALVALCANLGNLFDRAPGRSIKVASVGFLVVAVGSGLDRSLSGTALAVGAAAALFLDDMRERIMLGDAGANALGAAIGTGMIFSVAPSTRVAALIIVAVLNIASELVSFGRVIDAVGPMRAADRAGRRAMTRS